MRFAEYQRLLREGRAPQPDPLPKEARPLQGMRAGFVTRALAVFIDIGVVAAVVGGTWATLWLLAKILIPLREFDLPRPISLILVGYVVMWIYWTGAWASTGKSLGGFVMGIRVVNHAGDRMGAASAALRSAFCVVFQPGLLWVVVSRKNKSVQDVLLRTNVIHDWQTVARQPVGLREHDLEIE
ncbi:MAG: hypothetical protein RJB01_1093 [Actinomycetota bacterium]